ncbi:flagellar hook-basal body complex protein FliE [Paenibacillus lutrae]|uniref:Flagellar hook-basal body complex protein FliE n=1 Tax=Paenibacillus lutrae TaxID=2078573 RepID=A0A7X3FGQ6_9BACL|nr:flagellar hook-basal body complex protein FliE [Paenibacillus lutrae]MVO99163.1 flagellar hook-basal body complex protein FliE [Paenibacillus lutrae]
MINNTYLNAFSPVGNLKQPAVSQTVSASDVTNQFSSFLNNAINGLNGDQQAVDKLNQQFAKGELSDVHQLMIASEKASLGLEFTVQVRNKAMEAYQEIMRMQL